MFKSTSPKFFRDFRLEEQFERRQEAFKPNLNVQPDVDLYRVDDVLTGAYVPPNAENEIEMQCFDLPAWQEVLTDEVPDCP